MKGNGRLLKTLWSSASLLVICATCGSFVFGYLADEQKAVISYLSSLSSRVSGYPGNYKAKEFILSKFNELGLDYVKCDTFTVVAPIDKGAYLKSKKHTYRIYPLWPNLVRTPSLPKGGIKGKIIYAGKSLLIDYDGKDVEGNIVLLDFDCGRDWINAFLLGAKAVIFIEPETASRKEAELKFLTIPTNTPRFWITRKDAELLLKQLSSPKGKDEEYSLECEMSWEKVIGTNIYGIIFGKDKRLMKEVVVISAYYDSMSIVPSLSPGAEQACSIAALLELARKFKQAPTRRSIMFLATDAHCLGLSGIRHFADTIAREGLRITKAYQPARKGIEVKISAEEGKEEYALCLQAKIKTIREGEWAVAYLSFNEGLWKIPENSYLEYDMFIDGNSACFNSGVDLAGGDVRALRDRSEVTDIKHPNEDMSDAKDCWLHRRIDISALAGKTFTKVLLAVDSPPGQYKKGLFKAYFKNIQIKDEKGNVLIDLYTNKPALPMKPKVEIRSGTHLITGYKITVEKAPKTRLTPEQLLARQKREVLPLHIKFFIGLDLSSKSDVVGVFYKGYFYNHIDEDLRHRYSEFGKTLYSYAVNIATAIFSLREEDVPKVFVNGINPIKGRTWQTYFVDRIAFESEAVTLSAKPAITFATTNDLRILVDTPHDKDMYINYGNLAKQISFLSYLLPKIIDEESIKDISIDYNNCLLYGKVLEFDPREGYIPNIPVKDAIVVARWEHKTYGGVRGDLMDISDSSGCFKFQVLGKMTVVPASSMQRVEAYVIDKSSANYGEIVYVSDLGEYGHRNYPQQVPIDWFVKEVTMVVFRGYSMTLFDTVEPRFYTTLTGARLFDAKTDCEPNTYGNLSSKAGNMVFMKPGEVGKIAMSSSLVGTQLVIINPSKENPMGEGYKFDAHKILPLLPYIAARDMWLLNDWRINLLETHGIKSDRLRELHQLSHEALLKAEEALSRKRYSEGIKYARESWAYELRVHPDVQQTGNDTVQGVVFYLILLLPSAYFLERLIFAFRDINKQIVGVCGIFLIIFLLLRYVHPAFEIALTPFMILLAFFVSVLSLVVISIILRKFDAMFKEYKKRTMGVHTTDIGRISATLVAFTLGISNMRKRKERTLLTITTLIILTFTLLSFTSVKTSIRETKMPLGKEAKYAGILIRDRNWGPLEENAYKMIQNELGKEDVVVCPRAWYYSSMAAGEQSAIDVQNAYNTRSYAISSVLGCTAEDVLYTANKAILKAGRWFDKNEKTLCCILPEEVADDLSVSCGDKVKIFGIDFEVIGILDSKKCKNVVDLDDEPYTPVDYLAMAGRTIERVGGEKEKSLLPQKYIHLLPQQVVILPYSFVMRLGGDLRSIAIVCRDSAAAEKILSSLLPRVGIDIFAGIENKQTQRREAYYCSAVGLTQFSGLQNLLIPILIAALIVFNTMLGSVYERVKEIGIYGSLGLAPIHVAILFLAEASVYGVIGGIAGYLVGQGVAKIIATFNLLPGLTLNYSSLSAVGTISIVISTVILSTIYPARKASRIGVPTAEYKWSIGEPEGDEWRFELPFTVSTVEAMGLLMFLKEFFEGHQEYSLGSFYTEKCEIQKSDRKYILEQVVWLAPYDLGVSQKMSISIQLSESGQEIYNVQFYIQRLSGDVASWKRTNRVFINTLRKQFLLWKTLSLERREAYGKQFLSTAAA
jgi:hypothetical protein